jgi:hypothetical protein
VIDGFQFHGGAVLVGLCPRRWKLHATDGMVLS